MKFLFIFSLIFILFSHNVNAENCDDWFKESKININDSCLLNCLAYPVDLGTYMCHNKCTDLCHKSPYENWIFEISDLYPGLTLEERALVAQYTTKMVKAYQLSAKAENLCLKLYPQSKTNDESDACRHFIWSALLHKELGADLTVKILNAHESEPMQPLEEKSMDLANNRLGQIEAEKMIKKKTFDDNALLEVFKKVLQEKRLIVLKPATGAIK